MPNDMTTRRLDDDRPQPPLPAAGEGAVGPDADGTLRGDVGGTPGGAIESRRSVLAALGVAVGGAVLIGGLNLLVDPFGAFGIDLLPAATRTGDTRTARAELLHRFGGETVLLGSSRTRIAYDGSLACVPGAPALNLGLDGTNMEELASVIACVLQRPNVRRIVLSLDLHHFTGDWSPNSDSRCSRFNLRRSAFEHGCDLLWNGRSLEASVRALKQLGRDLPAEHDAWGFAVQAGERLSRTPQDRRTRTTLWRICGPQGQVRGMELATGRFALLDESLDRCRARGVAVTLVIDPTHALLLEGIDRCGSGAAYAAWKRELAAVADRAGVTLWDFTGYNAYTTEPLLTSPAGSPSRWF